jgi:hypothetical protein
MFQHFVTKSAHPEYGETLRRDDIDQAANLYRMTSGMLDRLVAVSDYVARQTTRRIERAHFG